MIERTETAEFRPIRILLIEDNAVDARLLELLLGEQSSQSSVQHQLVRVEQLSDGLAQLGSQRFDVILLDLSLPDSQGFETFQKAHAGARETPILVLSGMDDENLAIRAVREGAQDYLVKGRIDGYLLSRAISYAIERKQAEERLVASEAFYHSLVENLPQNILRKDVKERFTFANQKFCAMLNKPLEEIIGKTDFDFYPPELAAKYQRDDQYVIRTGNIFETVEANVSPTGETIYVQVIKTPIFDAKEQIIGIQCIFWDITERKRWEERLQQANEDLARSEAALRKSHEELKAAQMQLIQAEKMESIGTLAAGVAHEVKNPLAIILMGVNYLTKKMPGGDEKIAQVLKEMQEAIDRADSITRGLLDYAAARQLSVTPRQMNQLLDDTLRMVRHEFTTRKIEIFKEFGQNLPMVSVDGRQIQQVFVNIFMNAAQAMPNGGKLSIRTYAKQVAETSHFEGSRQAERFWIGDTVVMTEVDDTGTGIPEEFLMKIFDPFFTTKPTGLGTGLGLPVSKKIIDLHGGRLEIKNKPDGGVRATVVLKGRN
jgi:PAS domain S-box-containing protein